MDQIYGGQPGILPGKYLIILDTYGAVKELPLESFGKTRIYFGRKSDNDIVVPASMVSGQHGKFKIDHNRLLYADLGSTNGTILEADGYQRILKGNQKYYEMHSGDMLRIQPEESAPDNSILILYMDSSSEGVWRRFPLLASKVRIGRDRDNDIILNHPAVSRFHAEIQKNGRGEVLYDLNSSNGVYINGSRVMDNQVLHEKDVIRIANNTLIYTNDMIFYKNKAQGINIEARNVNKFVGKERKQILKNVDVTIESNEFVAIVGGSGAGKTTLMNAISGFDKKCSGSICFNGVDVHAHFNDLKDLIGFVPQEDIIYENLTLKKMLYYTAKLKMSKDTTREEIEERIQEVLGMVELTAHQNTFIRKLSGGQKKRASIAVELLADPSVFFLDEPTSGLDPGTEQKLMITLNKLSKSQGKTIVMVTHTTQSLQLCDKVIFMGRGGQLTFCGTTDQARMFFGTEDLVDIYNMTTDDPGLWAEQFKNCSDESSRTTPPSADAIKHKSGGFPIRQLPILTIRYLELIKNDLQRLLLLFAQPLLIALLLTVVANDNAFEVYDDTKSILFSLSCAGIWIGLFNSIQEICKERAILKREYMGNLKLPLYTISKFFVQTLLGALQALIMMVVFSTLVGHPEEGVFFSNAFFEMWLTVWMTIEASMALGFVVSALVKSGDRAMTFAPFILIIQLLFSGILFKLEGASEKIAYATVSKWSVEALGSISNLNNLKTKMEVEMPDVPGVEHKFEEIFEATRGHLAQNWLILIGMMLLCAIVTTVLLRSVARDSR